MHELKWKHCTVPTICENLIPVESVETLWKEPHKFGFLEAGKYGKYDYKKHRSTEDGNLMDIHGNCFCRSQLPIEKGKNVFVTVDR